MFGKTEVAILMEQNEGSYFFPQVMPTTASHEGNFEGTPASYLACQHLF